MLLQSRNSFDYWVTPPNQSQELGRAMIAQVAENGGLSVH